MKSTNFLFPILILFFLSIFIYAVYSGMHDAKIHQNNAILINKTLEGIVASGTTDFDAAKPLNGLKSPRPYPNLNIGSFSPFQVAEFLIWGNKINKIRQNDPLAAILKKPFPTFLEVVLSDGQSAPMFSKADYDSFVRSVDVLRSILEGKVQFGVQSDGIGRIALVSYEIVDVLGQDTQVELGVATIPVSNIPQLKSLVQTEFPDTSAVFFAQLND